MQHRLYLLFVGVDVMIDGQFVTDGIEVLAEQTIVVQRSDEVFQDVTLTLCQVTLPSLLEQLVLERFRGAEHHLLAVFRKVTATMVNG